mgnify:CR=1 FL=1
MGRDDIGELTVGKQADLALFKMDGLSQAGSLSDPLAALVFTTRSRPVDHLIINGNQVITHGNSFIDESVLAMQHNRIASKMLERASERTNIKFR